MLAHVIIKAYMQKLKISVEAIGKILQKYVFILVKLIFKQVHYGLPSL
jgi:hypothetical protein